MDEPICMWCDELADLKGRFIETGLYFQACKKHMRNFLSLGITGQELINMNVVDLIIKLNDIKIEAYVYRFHRFDTFLISNIPEHEEEEPEYLSFSETINRLILTLARQLKNVDEPVIKVVNNE